MKHIRLIWILCWSLLSAAAIHAQEKIQLTDGCNFADRYRFTELYIYEASAEADSIFNEILSAHGISRGRIQLKMSNVENAVATIVDGQRYILYSHEFLQRINAGGQNRWAVYCVLAHELGHHANFHEFSEKSAEQRREMELQADVFSGMIMNSLCASEVNAQAGIRSLQGRYASEYYPDFQTRQEFISVGWYDREDYWASIGEHPCGGTPIELNFGDAYKHNLSENVRARVYDKEMVISYDAVAPPGRINCKSFIVTSEKSGLRPNHIEWRDNPERFGNYKEMVWHFEKDNLTKRLVSRSDDIGIGTFLPEETPEPIPSETFLLWSTGMLVSGSLSAYGFKKHGDAMADYEVFKTTRDPNAPVFADLGREGFFNEVNRRHKTTEWIRWGSLAAFAGCSFVLFQKWKKHQQSRLGIIYAGDYGAGIKWRF